VLRRSPGHQARGQQSSATYKYMCMCTFRHDIVTINREVVDGEEQESLSTHPGPSGNGYRHKVLYSYSHFSTAK